MSGIEKVMVFGAGISGKGAAMELADQGKTVFLYDDMPVSYTHLTLPTIYSV